MADPRIQLFHTLSVLLDSGVPLLRALQVAGNTAAGGFKRPMRRIEEEVRGGRSLAESMADIRAFKPLDVALVRTGEETGQLSETLEELSRWYEFSARLRRTIISGLAYPALVLHFAAFVAPLIPVFLSGFNWDGYWRGVLSILAIFYVPLLAVVGILRFSPRRGPLRLLMDRFFLSVPVLGTAVKKMAISRYCKAFALMYGGGIPILKAAEQAPDACGNMAMARRFERASEAVQMGRNMSEGFPRSVGQEFLAIWEVGEEAGDLDVSAARLGSRYADEAEHLFGFIAQMVPRILYFLLLLYIGFLIVTAYMQIFSGAMEDL